MSMLTIIGRDLIGTKYYFSEMEILANAALQELAIKINFCYNQVARLDTRIAEMLDSTAEWNQMKWDNITKQRDSRQTEFETLLAAYNKKL